MANPVIIIVLGAAFFCGATVKADQLYDFEIFKTIDRDCLNRLWTNRGDMHLIGQTLDSFVSMVEKVEGNHTDWDIYRVSRALLMRFAFEGMHFSDLGGDRDAVQFPDAKIRWDIISKLVGTVDINSDAYKMNENILTEQEKCSMFFMMGHLINDTYRENIDDELMMNVPMDSPAGTFQRADSKKAKQPREQGVISISGKPEQAVSISKVLNAIVASQSKNSEFNVKDLYNIGANNFPDDKLIDPLIGVTLADVLSLAGIHHKAGTGGRTYFGPGGVWNSTVCPTEFRLHENATGSTNGLLRGAVDGLLIGKALQSMDNTDGVRLSRVLRMYYSRRGIFSRNSPNDGYSHCKRSESLGQIGDNTIRASAEAFYLVHGFKEYNKVLNNADQKVQEAYQNMQTALGEIDGELRGSSDCPTRIPNEDNPTCETPANVLVVLDSSEVETEGYYQQQEVIGLLASKLDYGRGGGSLSVLHNIPDSHGLRVVAINATNPSCAACDASRIDRTHFRPETVSEIAVLNSLNLTLQKFERVTDLEPGVPNKVVVYFHFGDLKETSKKNLQSAVNIIRDGHRDTRVIVVGDKADALNALTTAGEYTVTDIRDVHALADTLVEKICKVPAIFQFNRCFDKKKATRKESENTYTGYVTPDHVQFWAFYPEYFLKSYNIKITFKAENGDIRVCEERGHQNPGFVSNSLKKEKCKTTDSGNKEVSFKYKDPCHTYHAHNCAPINFAVVGIPSQSGQMIMDCPKLDNHCRRLDQVKFTMSHEGMYCSGCEFLKASPYALLIAVFLYFFKSV